MSESPKTIYLSEYCPPAYSVEELELYFDLHDDHTKVRARQRMTRLQDEPLILDGNQLELIGIECNGIHLSAGTDYDLDDEKLVIRNLPESFELTVTTLVYPHLNTQLEGLYRSSGNYCTQCEAEGFRRITYFMDRPDVLTSYTTTIEADKKQYPVLLSNGNLVKSQDLEHGRHSATWHDPFKKPCYLFAMVAGDLACIQDEFITMSGRRVDLRIYVESHNADKCAHAMRSLKKSMRWDEEVYGREYDLDIYMIVAVDDFNMGAMENKGLNVFNSKYVLARPDTATDQDYENIESVIAHEYFHNWSGNRVTCRDWFQLSLKEGFTVFRDQMFTADMTSHGVKRIEDVNILRNHQFVEDAGPLAHPVRPESYIEINNFYTVTIYNKGAEVVRMLHTLLGKDLFRQGCDLYFDRFDGQAVTIEDFVNCMEAVSGRNLKQFRLWYSQKGTPELQVETQFDEAKGELAVVLRQLPPKVSRTDSTVKPFHIPVRLGLVGRHKQQSHLVELTETQQVFTFAGLEEKPVLSLLQGFSAPVKVIHEQSVEEKMLLASTDEDAFNRWNAAQSVYLQDMLGALAGEAASFANSIALMGKLLAQDYSHDPRMLARMLEVPSYNMLAEQLEQVDPVRLWQVRKQLRQVLASAHEESFKRQYNQYYAKQDDDVLSQLAIGQRAVKNRLLSYLMLMGERHLGLAHNQLSSSLTMTDTLAAFSLLAESEHEEFRESAIASFYQRWKGETLVIDKWFAAQAAADLPDQIERIEKLMGHADFSYTNPNRLRSVVGTFAAHNPAHFHRADGGGYRWLASVLAKVDGLNPQVAARMAQPFSRWRELEPGRQIMMREQIEGLISKPGISKDLYEILSKSL